MVRSTTIRQIVSYTPVGKELERALDTMFVPESSLEPFVLVQCGKDVNVETYPFEQVIWRDNEKLDVLKISGYNYTMYTGLSIDAAGQELLKTRKLYTDSSSDISFDLSSILFDSVSPTVENKFGEWNSVNDHQPTSSGRYLCTYKQNDSCCIDFGSYNATIQEWYCSGVIAWMPLPVVYQE